MSEGEANLSTVVRVSLVPGHPAVGGNERPPSSFPPGCLRLQWSGAQGRASREQDWPCGVLGMGPNISQGQCPVATLEDGSIDKVNREKCLGLVARARAEATEEE